MPFNGSGNYSPPAPPTFPVVTQTVISSTDFNATINDIAAALTACVTRDGQSPMTGTLPMGGQVINALGLGSAGTPAISFTGAASTGIYAPGAGQFGISISGAAALTINANRNVVIPAPASGAALSITGLAGAHALDLIYSAAGQTPLRMTDGTCTFSAFINGASGARWNVETNHPLEFWTNNTSRFTIAAAGTAAFLSNIEHKGATPVYSYVDPGNAGVSTFRQLDSGGYVADLSFHSSAHATRPGQITLNSGTSIRLLTNGVERVVVGPAGNVTIGAPSSGSGLTLNGGSQVIAAGIGASTAIDFAPNGIAVGAGMQLIQTNALLGAWINRNNAASQIWTNNSVRATFLATGGLDIAAPSSGVALTVAAVGANAALVATGGGGQDVAIFNGGAGQDAIVKVLGNATTAAYLLLGNGSSGERARIAADNGRNLYFSTNGGTHWQLDASNRLLNPGNTQPSFSAGSSAARTTGGTFITYAGVTHNFGTHFNASTGIFQAPVPGVYEFFATFSGIVSSGTGALLVQLLDGSGFTWGLASLTLETTTRYTNVSSGPVQMAQGQTMRMDLITLSGTGASSTVFQFSGRQVG